VEKLILTANPRSYASLKRDLLLVCEKPLSQNLLKEMLAHADSPLTFLLLALRDSAALRHVLEEGGEEVENTVRFSVEQAEESTPWQQEETRSEVKKFDGEQVLSDLLFQYESEGLDSLPEKLSVSQILKDGREEEGDILPRRLLDFQQGKLTFSAAQIGTATHKVMQFANFENMEKDGEGEILRLKEKGFLSEEEYSLAEKEKIFAFFRSDLYEKIKKSPALTREKRFNVLLSGEEILGKKGEVLVQGVIDAFFENPDGTLTLFDFKTDRVKKEDGDAVLIDRHKDQLHLYAKAVEAMTNKKVSTLLLWSFALEKAVLIPREEN
jgi:ATP-dependent helicase/nuclease subunit A